MAFERLFDWLFAPIARLAAALSDPERRERTAILTLIGYVAIWTLYAVLAKGSQDIHRDMSELVAWSREPGLGYAKHPPFGAWLTALWFALFPVADWSFYLLAMTASAVALWFAWRIAGDYLDPEKRVLALALLMLVPFFNFLALKMNANTILIPLWAATTFCFLRSFERRTAGWAALAGLCAALAMFGKYWSIFLLAGLGLAAVLDSRRAAYFRSAAPWVTIAVGAAAIAPHLVWLVTHNFEPLSYAFTTHSDTEDSALWSVVIYLGAAVAYVAVPVLLMLAATRPGGAALLDLLWPATPARQFVVMAYWAPLLLPALAAPVLSIGLSSVWSMSALTLMPVVLLSSPLLMLRRKAMLAAVAIAAVVPLIMVAAAPVIAARVNGHDLEPAAAHASLLAKRIEREWRRVTYKPLNVVGGEQDLVFGVAFYLPSRPLAFPAGDFNTTVKLVTPARLARGGMAIVCGRSSNPCPTQFGPIAHRSIEVDIARTYRGVTDKPAHYVITIIPPAPSD
jgi:4-amino-4-deoxy-L-arabinose transferase-like glycosyltransferase